jgi:hypothetical protein
VLFLLARHLNLPRVDQELAHVLGTNELTSDTLRSSADDRGDS